jgi:hypothetical protein
MSLVRSEFKRKAPSAEPKPAKGPKQRKCSSKACRALFVPPAPFIRWCSVECGAAIALEKLAQQKLKAARAERAIKKLERAETKSKLEQHKPLAYWLAKVERVCNEYIRARDPNICISCGVTDSSAWQAGHYVSVGANGTLRFNEDNIHKQCIQCNMFKGSNATAYRIGLIEKIGVARVEALEAWHAPIKMTRADCEELETYYRAKLRALTKGPQ